MTKALELKTNKLYLIYEEEEIEVVDLRVGERLDHKMYPLGYVKTIKEAIAWREKEHPKDGKDCMAWYYGFEEITDLGEEK
jgi:hypothetical protein